MADIVANMAGTVFQVLVTAGDKVSEGQDVIVLESMKMEVPIASGAAGTVKQILVAVGDFVNEGDAVVELDA